MTAAETSLEKSRIVLRVLPMRDGHLLFELESLEKTLALHAALEASPIVGVREIIPAARTLMIAFDHLALPSASLIEQVQDRLSSEASSQPGPIVDIPVLYDGEDLKDVAALLNLSVDEIIARHTGSDLKVAFTGFAPGFAYLSGGDEKLAVPRRTSPRTHVPAGSVAIAGEFSGVYPKASPGGWQLIGRTPIPMFDLAREPASLLQPGYRVKFRQISLEEFEELQAAHKPSPSPVSLETSGPCLEVLSAPLPLLLQDLGRKGKASLGVSLSGAADRAAFRQANRAVGNPVNLPALEISPAGAVFKTVGESVIAITGAPVMARIEAANGDMIEVELAKATALNDEDRLTIAPPAQGMRSYLSIRGGFAASSIIDSAARDTLAEIGPAPLKSGDRISIAPADNAFIVPAPTKTEDAHPKAGETVELDVVMGPRTDWFTSEAVQSFLSQDWLVTPQASRVGIRLEGTPLTRSITAELPSEATLHGAIQVPASGQPVLFLVDHPLTGGYPVIGNVAEYHLDLAARVPPGARIRFRAIEAFHELPLPNKHIAEHQQ